jgi:hypothetical protein
MKREVPSEKIHLRLEPIYAEAIAVERRKR